MDLSSCLRSFGADLDGPCACLGFSGSQITDETKQTVAGCDQFFKTGFGQTEIFEEHLFLVLVQFCDFLFNLCTDNKYLAVVLSCKFANLFYIFIGSTVICQIILRYVGSEDNRFPG